jgi:glutamate dehydrogenase
VVGEGANLGVTQLGRIEYARTGGPAQDGGKINTDAIDNSGGVDASDHEVNIKILLGTVIDSGDLTLKQRNALLVTMTDELAELILRDNYLQTQAISVMEAHGTEQLDAQLHFIKTLEKAGKLNRGVEKLPSDEAIAVLAAAGKGLTRPELAVLLAYGKLTLYEDLLNSALPDEAFLLEDLFRYFPTALREKFKDAIAKHRLRREIIATVATNSMVNRVGPTFVNDMNERTGSPPGDVAHAYTVTRDAFMLRGLWAGIEALDAKVPAQAQIAMIRETGRLVTRCALWFLQNMTHPIDVGAAMADFKPGIEALAAKLMDVLPAEDRDRLLERAAAFTKDGAPEDLALGIAKLDWLGAAPDIIRLANRDVNKIAQVAELYYGLGAALDLKWLRHAARSIPAETSWQKQAVAAIVEDLYAFQAELTSRVLASGQSADAWLLARGSAAQRVVQLTNEMRAAGSVDLAMLAVANRQLRALIAG